MRSAINVVAAAGLAVGAIFGIAGTVVTHPGVQSLLWGIDGTGLVMASALLALKFFRSGDDFVAGGFLAFAVAEAVLMSGSVTSHANNASAFATGSALWALALVLVSAPRRFPLPVRLLGLASAVLFAIVAARMLWGEALSPTSAPLPFYAYPFLAMTFVGWIWSLLRE